MRLDIRDKFPIGMEEYLAHHGWHFSKSMCKFAVDNMIAKNKEPIIMLSKIEIKELLNRYNITIEHKNIYDISYVIHMCKADYFNSSIKTEEDIIRFAKDYIEDEDGYDEVAFTRFYADCIGKGISIPWEDVI